MDVVIGYMLVIYILNTNYLFTGVGTRNYYRKLGYELDGPYMSKMLV